MSRPHDSRTKSMYQGQVLKRTQRSEYDDNRMRDLARHDNRLGNDLKEVERARTVMKKSMEADKQLFIRSNPQNNTLMTKSKTSNNRILAHSMSSAAGTSSAQHPHSRLVSDTRVKKTSTSDSEPPDLQGLKVESSSSKSRSGRTQKSPSSAPRTPTKLHENAHDNLKIDSNSANRGGCDRPKSSNIQSGTKNNGPSASPTDATAHSNSDNKRRSSKDGTRSLSTDAILDNTDSLYDSFFQKNTKNDPTSTQTTTKTSSTKAHTSGTTNGRFPSTAKTGSKSTGRKSSEFL